MVTYKNFVNGKWVNSSSGKTFSSKNPATEKILATFQSSNEKDVNLATNAAESAFEKWNNTPAPKRGEILLRAAQLMRSDKEHLAQMITKEMGKIICESRGEVQEAIDTLEYMAGEGRRLFGYTTTSELHDKFAMTVRRPIGVCGIISPWNFPIAIPTWKISAALICGNTVVFKPASDTPLCGIEFVNIFNKACLPNGVLNLVTGSGSAVGMPIVRHKKTRCISFTGSRDTGETIMKEAGIKRIGLELGGKNGIIIMDDADINLALDGVVWGAFGTTGQRCTATSRVIIHKKVKNEFEKKLVEKVKHLRIGNGLVTKTDIGPLINLPAVGKTEMYVDIGKQEGAKLLCGGERIHKFGFFYKPTIFTNVSSDMRIAQEEIFGPMLSIIEISNLDEAIEVINNIEYGLSSSIYTKNIKSAFEAIKKIEAGITYINSSTTGAEVHLPFGGVKCTGNVREGGIEGMNEFSETTTVYFDYSGRLQRAQIDVNK